MIFAGTEQSADDCIARDVGYLLRSHESLRIAVVTSDSGLAIPGVASRPETSSPSVGDREVSAAMTMSYTSPKKRTLGRSVSEGGAVGATGQRAA